MQDVPYKNQNSTLNKSTFSYFGFFKNTKNVIISMTNKFE